MVCLILMNMCSPKGEYVDGSSQASAPPIRNTDESL